MLYSYRICLKETIILHLVIKPSSANLKSSSRTTPRISHSALITMQHPNLSDTTPSGLGHFMTLMGTCQTATWAAPRSGQANRPCGNSPRGGAEAKAMQHPTLLSAVKKQEQVANDMVRPQTISNKSKEEKGRKKILNRASIPAIPTRSYGLAYTIPRCGWLPGCSLVGSSPLFFSFFSFVINLFLLFFVPVNPPLRLPWLWRSDRLARMQDGNPRLARDPSWAVHWKSSY